MKLRRAVPRVAVGIVLVVATGCAQGPGILSGPTATEVPSLPAASTQSGPAPSGQASDSPLQVTTIPLGKNSGVEARFPINGYFAAPGMEIAFDASESVGAVSTYKWDFDGDGTYDASTTEPVFKHTFTDEFEGELALRVSNPIGSTRVRRIPVHVSTKPYHQQLAPPKDVQADSWAIAINGVPIGRIEKAARPITVTDIERKEDVLVEVFGVTADIAGSPDGIRSTHYDSRSPTTRGNR